MELRANRNWGVGPRLLLLVGVMAGIPACAVLDTRPFDGVVAIPSGVVVEPSSSARQGPSPTVSSGASKSSPVGPEVVRVSYQQPAQRVKSGPEKKDDSDKLPPPRKAEEQPTAKEATSDSSGTTGKLTFDQVIRATLLADPKIRAGLEAINQANADLLTSSLPPNPTLLIDGIFLPLRRWTPQKPGGPPQMDVQVGYPIDWFLFGKRAAAMASATLAIRQSESDYADLIRQRVRDAAVAFYDVVEAKAVLDLARQDVENLTKFEAALSKAVDAGGRPVVELNRVRLDLLKSQQALREAEAAFAIAKAKLRSFFGRTDPDPSFDVQADLDAPLAAEPLPVEEAYAAARQSRPDIQSLRWQVSKAQADTVVERRKAFPQITPLLGYTRQFQTEVLGVPDADSLTVSVTSTLPFFDRNQGNRAKAQSIAIQNGFNLQAGVVDLRAEIEQVVQEFRTALQTARSVAQEHLKRAAEVRDSISKAYDVGGRPLIDVLDAQRNYRETYRLYINSRANYWRSVYNFSAAIGRQVVPNDEQPR
jgi:cobalt-zinc-cadmium efflux system outer membrane protein